MRVLGVSPGVRTSGLALIVTGERWRYGGTLWIGTVPLGELYDLVRKIVYLHSPRLTAIELPKDPEDRLIAGGVEGVCRLERCETIRIASKQWLRDHRLQYAGRDQRLRYARQVSKGPEPKTEAEAVALLVAITGAKVWWKTCRTGNPLLMMNA
jgi:hypothetical protein